MFYFVFSLVLLPIYLFSSNKYNLNFFDMFQTTSQTGVTIDLRRAGDTSTFEIE